jgi:hypothetical protein
MATLNKKQFEFIATILRAEWNGCPKEHQDAIRRVINAFADLLPPTAGGLYYDREQFKAACYGIRLKKGETVL